MGLSLTLNVEQYEYMTGPNGDAGVKVIFLIYLVSIFTHIAMSHICKNSFLNLMELDSSTRPT